MNVNMSTLHHLFTMPMFPFLDSICEHINHSRYTTSYGFMYAIATFDVTMQLNIFPEMHIHHSKSLCKNDNSLYFAKFTNNHVHQLVQTSNI